MIYFREVQRLWIWVLLVVALSAPVAAVVRALPQNLGGHAGPPRLPYVVLGLPALLAVWFSLGSLVTEVREKELSIHFHLLWPERVISWSEIRSAEAVTYFSRGWGVRSGGEGMTYNVSGNRGVRIELGGGERVMVGSQRAEELAEAIGKRIGGSRRSERWDEGEIQP